MSEEEDILGTVRPDAIEDANSDISQEIADEIQDFDQNGMLLKIATDGISVQDYVKRLKESDILVAVDGEIYRDGPAKLNEKFSVEAGDAPKWLLTFWRDGQLFDLLLTAPIRASLG